MQNNYCLELYFWGCSNDSAAAPVCWHGCYQNMHLISTRSSVRNVFYKEIIDLAIMSVAGNSLYHTLFECRKFHGVSFFTWDLSWFETWMGLACNVYFSSNIHLPCIYVHSTYGGMDNKHTGNSLTLIFQTRSSRTHFNTKINIGRSEWFKNELQLIHSRFTNINQAQMSMHDVKVRLWLQSDGGSSKIGPI